MSGWTSVWSLWGTLTGMLPIIGLPQLVFILVAVLVIWSIYRPRGTVVTLTLVR